MRTSENNYNGSQGFPQTAKSRQASRVGFSPGTK